ADDGLYTDVAQVIHGERHIVTDVVAHGSNIFAEPVDTLICDFSGNKEIRLRVLLPVAKAGGLHDSTRNVVEHIDAEIHLHPRESHLFAFLGAAAVFGGIFRLGGIRINTNLVTPFAAEHLEDGDVIDLAGNIPERHLHCAHAAGLASVAAELRDFLEEIVDAQRILAEQSAFEHHGILRAGDVAHFAQAIDALIGVNADERARARPRLDDHRVAHIGNLER